MIANKAIRFGKYEKEYGLAIEVQIKDFVLFRENQKGVKDMFDRMYSHALNLAGDVLKISIRKD